jgi:hypothetical protein
MSLACGCSFAPGSPVPLNELRKHFVHTFETMMYWELLGRFNKQDTDLEIELSECRIRYMAAIDKLFPEAMMQEHLFTAKENFDAGVKK